MKINLPSLPFIKQKKKDAPQGETQAAPGNGGTEKENSNASAIKFGEGMVSVADVIAPPAIEVDFDHLKIGSTYYRTLFVAGYPRFVSANWLSPLISFDHSLNISMFIYPVEGKSVLDDLRRKIAEMEAEISTDIQRGRVINPGTKAKLEDAYTLQEQLVKGIERFFQFSLYITVPASSPEELNRICKQVESSLGALLIIPKHASLQMEEGFKATVPLCADKLMITRNMDTTSLATTFPFTSSELTANEGILYGINEHNGSLVIFDRFTMENANSVVFAKSGAGKSYFVKLEAVRSLMFGTEILVIDPEGEYQALAKAVGGEFIDFGFNSSSKVNPFDLSQVYEEGENELGLKIRSLHSLFKVIMGELTPSEEAVLDQALVLTYKSKGITPEPATQKNEPPLIEDLYKVLIGMEEEESRSLAARVEKFVKGSFVGIFNQQSTIDIKNPFTVFSLRNLDDALRPIAMFIILDFIWTKVKKDLKKRILVVDEAWYLMRYPDSALFLTSIAKKARKYFLGLTTITQDVEDFLNVKIGNVEMGREIINNSSIQILMKQSTAAIDIVAKIFYLSEGEKNLLLAANVGEGLFFAGANHVRLRVVASPEEHQLITTNPEELTQKQAPLESVPVEQETSVPKPQTSYKPPFVSEVVQPTEETKLEYGQPDNNRQ